MSGDKTKGVSGKLNKLTNILKEATKSEKSSGETATEANGKARPPPTLERNAKMAIKDEDGRMKTLSTMWNNIQGKLSKESAAGTATEEDNIDHGRSKIGTMWNNIQGKLTRERGAKDSNSPQHVDPVSSAETSEQELGPAGTAEQFFFEYLVVVSLKRKTEGGYEPQITYQFPKCDEMQKHQKQEEEKTLNAITLFSFPEGISWTPLTEYRSETFSFVLTEVDGSRRNGYCRRLLPHGKGARLPEAYCIISKVACFGLFSKIFDEVEKRRQIAMAMIYPFMQSLREAPFPAPGNTVNIKSFIPESGTEIISLTRPLDSWLEHVNFHTLFHCLTDEQVIQVFAATVLERRIIFVAEELSTLSQVIHAVVALLHPFTWQHTLISIVPESLIDYVMAPIPYLLGVQKTMLDFVTDHTDLLIVDLTEGAENTFITSMGDENTIIPRKLVEEILLALSARKEESTPEELKKVVSDAFLTFFVKTVGHFASYVKRDRRGQQGVFQKKSFYKAVEPKATRCFLKKFVQTQMFDLFIQEVERQPASKDGFFQKKIAEYQERRRAEKAKKS